MMSFLIIIFLYLLVGFFVTLFLIKIDDDFDERSSQDFIIINLLWPVTLIMIIMIYGDFNKRMADFYIYCSKKLFGESK